MSFVVTSLYLLWWIQFNALKMLKTSTLFWSFEEDLASSSRERGFPSIRAEKSELASVDCLLIFSSTSGGIWIESITSLLASTDWRSCTTLGVSSYLGGISILPLCHILPDFTKYYQMFPERVGTGVAIIYLLYFPCAIVMAHFFLQKKYAKL